LYLVFNKFLWGDLLKLLKPHAPRGTLHREEEEEEEEEERPYQT